jgi:hypothetical protein
MDNKIRGRHLWNVVYLHILKGGTDIQIAFRLLLIALVLPCPDCAKRWFGGMLKVLSVLIVSKLFDITTLLPDAVYNKGVGMDWYNFVATVQNRILLEKGEIANRTGEKIKTFIEVEGIGEIED